LRAENESGELMVDGGELRVKGSELRAPDTRFTVQGSLVLGRRSLIIEGKR